MRRPLVSVLAAAWLYAGAASAQSPTAPPPVPPDIAAFPLPPPPAPPPVAAPALPPPPPTAASAATVVGEAEPPPGPVRRRRPAFWRDRLRLLNAMLPPLAERSRESRRTEILINTIAGAATVGLGFVFSEAGDGSTSLPAVLLWTMGGLQIAQGLAALAIPPARERLSDEFAALPQGTARQRHLRVRFGEEALDRMAADGARRRVIGAIVGVAAAFIPPLAIYSDQIFSGAPWPERSESTIIAFSLSGVVAIQALVPLFSRSAEERLRDEYRTRIRILREGGENQD